MSIRNWWLRTRLRLSRKLMRGTEWSVMHVSATRMLSLNALARKCHDASVAAGWWHDQHTGEFKHRNKGEMLMLMVSELAEAMEGERKNLHDDKLAHRRMAEVEFADLFIRAFDYAGYRHFDLDGAVAEKMLFNATREDHKPENRAKVGGKQW